MVRTISNNGMSIRKTLTYSGCSKNMYYNNNNSRKNNYRNHIASSSSSYRRKYTANFSAKANLWYQENGCNVNKNSWKTSQPKEGTERIFRKMGYITHIKK